MKGEVKGGKESQKRGARGSGIWLLKPSIVGIPTTGSMWEPMGDTVGASRWLYEQLPGEPGEVIPATWRASRQHRPILTGTLPYHGEAEIGHDFMPRDHSEQASSRIEPLAVGLGGKRQNLLPRDSIKGKVPDLGEWILYLPSIPDARPLINIDHLRSWPFSWARLCGKRTIRA